MSAVLLYVGLVGSSISFAEPASLREFKDEDAASWKTIASAQLTPDGHRLIYLLTPDPNVGLNLQGVTARGETQVVVRSTRGRSERRYSAGDFGAGVPSGALQISGSGRWIAFAKAGSAPRSNSLVALRVADDRRLEVPDVEEFSFVSPSTQKLLLKRNPDRGDGSGFDLTLLDPEGSTERTFTHVTGYVVDPSGMRLAMFGEHALQLIDLAGGAARVLDAREDCTYRGITWSVRGDALATLRSCEDGQFQDLLTFNQLPEASASDVMVWLPEAMPDFPSGYELAEELRWRDDGRGLFVGVRSREDSSAKQPGTPGLVLWHSADARLPGFKKATSGERPVTWMFLSLDDRRIVRLTRAGSDETVELAGSGPYLLVYDAGAHGRLNPRDGSATFQKRDYDLLDLRSGKRRSLFRGLQVDTRYGTGKPRIAPDGVSLLYQDNTGDFRTQDLDTGASRSLTAGLPAKFYLQENKRRDRWLWLREPAADGGFQGWTDDGAYALVSDYYDVWALPLKGGNAVNLTRGGEQRDISYSLAPPSDEGGLNPPRLDLRKPLYLNARSFKTGKEGIARYSPGKGRLEWVRLDDASGEFLKARDAEVYIRGRQTATQCNDYYLLDEALRPVARLTDANPQQREFYWPPGAKHLTYVTSHGEVQKAALLLPTHYEPGRRYPTVVSIYRQWGGLHAYNPFGLGISTWLRHGYAFLVPDVVPRMNEAGAAALESATAAVEEAVAAGIVDRARVGLIGHSYGAWETYFIVSQTDIFRAAIPYSGMTNLLSDFGAVYENVLPKAEYLYGIDQPFLAGSWWENREAYLRNSPLDYAAQLKTPLLILHGDRDGAVMFSQAVEMFTALRRLDHKQVALLQYVGEGHSLAGEALYDSERRSVQFFDHFLKGKPAPVWWSDGLSRFEGQVPRVDAYLRESPLP